MRSFKKLPKSEQTRVRQALEKHAGNVANQGRVKGKSVKTLQGVSDSFQRLRVGDYRVMHDVIEQDRVVLVLGIVHRGDIERWIRNR